MHILKTVKDKLSLILLIVFFLLCNGWYSPAGWKDSLLRTFIHIVSLAPFSVGLTLVIASILQRITRERLGMEQVIRIYLAISIVVGFFFGLYNHCLLYTSPSPRD